MLLRLLAVIAIFAVRELSDEVVSKLSNYVENDDYGKKK